MANSVYPLWKQSLMTEAMTNKSLDQTAANAPYVTLITTASGYVYSAAHQFYTSLTNIVGTPQPITSNTVANGLFNGATVTFTAVSGTVVGALVIYRQNAGANTTWQLVLYEDTSVTGLPVSPNGGNIIITWNASGIFQLSSKLHKVAAVQVDRLGPLGLYEFSYAGDDPAHRHRGFMADEVKAHVPEAVRAFDGVDYVNYRRAIEGIQLRL